MNKNSKIFISGFLMASTFLYCSKDEDNNRSHFARLVGVAVHKDGSLLASDDNNGIIYHISKV